MENQLLPVLDMNVLQEKTTEFAMKGAIKSIEEFYTGYNSPYRALVTEELNNQKIGTGIQLPDNIALINDSLSKEIAAIANAAITQSYLPKLKTFLTREDPEMLFSDFLKRFISYARPEDPEDCYITIDEDSRFGWLNIKLHENKSEYSLTFHVDHESKKQGIKKYSILSIPRSDYQNQSKMKLSFEGASVELPFVPSVLENEFISFCARLTLCRTLITMDVDDFDEDMFDRDECHCH